VSGRPSREKGARGELEVAHILKSWGFDCHRTPNSGGLFIPGDIVGVEGYSIEVKRTETVRMPAWQRQAQADCPLGASPVVAWRSNRTEWWAATPLQDFMLLLKARP
jgi:Holliday junction resolvase